MEASSQQRSARRVGEDVHRQSEESLLRQGQDQFTGRISGVAEENVETIIQQDNTVLFTRYLARKISSNPALAADSEARALVTSASLQLCVQADASSCLSLILGPAESSEARKNGVLFSQGNPTCVDAISSLLPKAILHSSVRCFGTILKHLSDMRLRPSIDDIRLLHLSLQEFEKRAVSLKDKDGPIEELVKRVRSEEKLLNILHILLNYFQGSLPRVAFDLAARGCTPSLCALLTVSGVSLINSVLTSSDGHSEATLLDVVVSEAASSKWQSAQRTGGSSSVGSARNLLLRMLRLLLLWKPNLNRQQDAPTGFSGSSAIVPLLVRAAKHSDVEAVTFLLEAGAPVQEVDGDGDSPLHGCLQSMQGADLTRMVWKLVKLGASVRSRNNLGLAPVHVAAANGHLQALKVMLAFEPDAVDFQSAAEESPLFWAVQADHADCVHLLLQCGAQRNHKNSRGQTPRCVAHSVEMRAALDVERVPALNKETLVSGLPDDVREKMEALAESILYRLAVSGRARKGRSMDMDSGNSSRNASGMRLEVCKYYSMPGGCVKGDTCGYFHPSGGKRAESRARIGSWSGSSWASNRESDELGKKIFIGGLSPTVESDDLREFFGQRYGPIVDAVVISSQSGSHVQSRGFGFVTFKNEASAVDAVKDHYVLLMGKKVEIKSAIPRPLMAESKALQESKTVIDEEDDEAMRRLSLDENDNGDIQPYDGPPPPWLTRLREWLPDFLQQASSRLKEGESYPLSSLKGDFRATCGMEMDHVSIGYPKLSDFVRSLRDIVKMRVTPVGRGPATHMILLPQKNPPHRNLPVELVAPGPAGNEVAKKAQVPASTVSPGRTYAAAILGQASPEISKAHGTGASHGLQSGGETQQHPGSGDTVHLPACTPPLEPCSSVHENTAPPSGYTGENCSLSPFQVGSRLLSCSSLNEIHRRSPSVPDLRAFDLKQEATCWPHFQGCGSISEEGSGLSSYDAPTFGRPYPGLGASHSAHKAGDIFQPPYSAADKWRRQSLDGERGVGGLYHFEPFPHTSGLSTAHVASQSLPLPAISSDGYEDRLTIQEFGAAPWAFPSVGAIPETYQYHTHAVKPNSSTIWQKQLRGSPTSRLDRWTANDKQQNLVCAACQERKAQWLALPCQHLCLCAICKQDIQAHSPHSNNCCIQCSKLVERWVAV